MTEEEIEFLGYNHEDGPKTTTTRIGVTRTYHVKDDLFIAGHSNARQKTTGATYNEVTNVLAARLILSELAYLAA